LRERERERERERLTKVGYIFANGYYLHSLLVSTSLIKDSLFIAQPTKTHRRHRIDRCLAPHTHTHTLSLLCH